MVRVKGSPGARHRSQEVYRCNRKVLRFDINALPGESVPQRHSRDLWPATVPSLAAEAPDNITFSLPEVRI